MRSLAKGNFVRTVMKEGECLEDYNPKKRNLKSQSSKETEKDDLGYCISKRYEIIQ